MLFWTAILVFGFAMYYLIVAEKKKKHKHELHLREIQRKIAENEKKKNKDKE